MPLYYCEYCRSYVSMKCDVHVACKTCGHIPASECRHEPKFQVGDRVRTVVGEVRRTGILVQVAFKGLGRWNLDERVLELVERPVKYKPGDKFLSFNTPMIYLEHRPDGLHRLFNCLAKNIQGFSDISHMTKVDSFD